MKCVADHGPDQPGVPIVCGFGAKKYKKRTSTNLYFSTCVVQLAYQEATLVIAAIVSNFVLELAVGMEPPVETAKFTLGPSHCMLRVRRRQRSAGSGG